MFCRSLFVLLYFFYWPLCSMSLFDIRILITPLTSSNSSCIRFIINDIPTKYRHTIHNYVIFCVFTFRVPCGGVRYYFRNNKTLCSVRLYPRLSVGGAWLICVICACLRIVVSNTYCVVFFLRLVYPMLPVSLDCQFLIAPSVFSNVYLSVSLDCQFLIAPSVFSNVYLSVSLDCQFLIAPSVFSNVSLTFVLASTLSDSLLKRF